ncbi:MAG TPA: ABC transporter permease subunit, partial [Patescibacteria group bacterium]|nr:ABC transporter permease subunit [Patescibacteria group bacterium]
NRTPKLPFSPQKFYTKYMAIRHYHHRYHFSYLTSKKRHFSAALIVIAALTLILLALFHYLTPQRVLDLNDLSPTIILLASFNTLFRLLVAYTLSLALSLPIALLITKNERMEKILLPVSDIIQSVPVLAFFPIIVLVFIKLHATEGAVVFILFMAMLWNLVFSMIGGLKTIPKDILDAAKIFNIKGFIKLRYVTIPAIFPFIITGSLLAWAQGWSILIVAEALHSYIPSGMVNSDPLGLGSLLVNAFSKGENSVFLGALITMVVLITLINFFVWQKLLHLAERFKFD